MNYEKTSLTATIIIGVLQIALAFLALVDCENYINFAIIIVLIIVTAILFNSIISTKYTNYRYNLIKYLFHNDNVNQFNILPKLIVMRDYQQKKNTFSVDSIVMTHNLFPTETTQVDDFVSWDMSGVKNTTANQITEYYFYYGVEIGTSMQPSIVLSDGIKAYQYRILDITKSNGICLFKFGIDKPLQPNSTFSSVKLNLNTKGAFDFSETQVIYFFPKNFAKNINRCSINIITHGFPYELNMELREIGRHGLSSVKEHILAPLLPDKREGCTVYSYDIDKKTLHMDSIYYVLIKKQIAS